MDDFKKAKKIIEKAQTVNLLPSPKFQKDSFPATLALFYSLKQLAKNVNLLADGYPQRFKFLVKRENVHPSQSSFLISIREAKAKLSQLFYEKTDEGLNLFLKTRGGELKKEDISLKPSFNIEDLLITIGGEDFSKDDNSFRSRSNPVINIDNETDLQTITAHLYGMVREGAIRIFSRVLGKLNNSEEQDFAWVLLQKQDFEATESLPADLKFTLRKLSSGLFPFQGFLMLWETESSPLSIWGVFYSLNKGLLEKVLTNFGGQQKGQGILFQTKETDLQKVKDKILNVIRICE